MTARDKKGRFTKKNCKVRKAKDALKKWWSNHGDAIIVLFCLWIVLTGVIWLFGDKQIPVCQTHYKYRQVTNETPANATIVNWSLTWNATNNEVEPIKMEKYVSDPCAWNKTGHTHYTILESIGVERDWFIGALSWTWNALSSTNEWLLGHPVI
jgi:hypothetical protein